MSRVLTDYDGNKWMEITKKEYEQNKDDVLNYFMCFDQDSNKAVYCKLISLQEKHY